MKVSVGGEQYHLQPEHQNTHGESEDRFPHQKNIKTNNLTFSPQTVHLLQAPMLMAHLLNFLLKTGSSCDCIRDIYIY